MGTQRKDSPAATLLGRTRQAVLALLYGHPDESFYLRQIIRIARAGQGAVQRELASLVRAGIVERRVRGRQTYYQANRECPIFPELRQLITKTVGIADVLRAALETLEQRIDVAFVYGSLARGELRPGSDVDLLVVGEVTFSEIVAALQSAQQKLGREINPTVYPAAEFRKKLAAGHHFLSAVAADKKIFLIGDPRELATVAHKRLA